jgi:hypothetical protein
MKTLIACLLMIFCLNTYAGDFGLSLGVKDHKSIVGVKAYIFKVEVSDKSDNLSDKGPESVLIRSSEVNFAIEPDITVKQFDRLSLKISPLIGVSQTTSSTSTRTYIGTRCTRDFAHTNKYVGSECTSESNGSETNFYNGAAIKLGYEVNKQGFELSLGAYSNTRKMEYKPQVSVGYIFGF